MSIITDEMPFCVRLSDIEYRVHTDFRNWLKISELLEQRSDNVAEILTLCYIDLPPNFELAMKGLYTFYIGNARQKSKQSEKKQRAIYSFSIDSDYIYAAFLSQYRINLQTEKLHWHSFLSLFYALDDNNMIIKIMQYRSIDLAKIKDKEQKAYYRKMKDLYKLPDMRTAEEKEIDMMITIDSII